MTPQDELKEIVGKLVDLDVKPNDILTAIFGFVPKDGEEVTICSYGRRFSRDYFINYFFTIGDPSYLIIGGWGTALEDVTTHCIQKLKPLLKVSNPRIVTTVDTGAKVVRGRDWSFGDQDDKSIYGVIVGKSDNGWVKVSWKDAEGREVFSESYRIGGVNGDKYDLYYYEEPAKVEPSTDTVSYEPLESFEDVRDRDVLVSLSNRGHRKTGEIMPVQEVSGKPNAIDYKGGCHSYRPEEWRRATPEEIEAFNSGITNINDIHKKPEPKCTHFDKVTFKVGDDTYSYTVYSQHLNNNHGVDSSIFTALNLDKDAFCAEHYGYTPLNDFSWPHCKPSDFAALNRVIEALQKECDKFNAKNAEPAESVPNAPKFKVGDKVKVLSYGSQDPGMVGKICTISRVKISSDRSCWYELEEELIKFLWEEHRLEAVVEEPKEFESVKARLDYIRDVKGITTPEGIFKELFGFARPEHDTELISNGDTRKFHVTNFASYYIAEKSYDYGDPNYIIEGFWVDDETREGINRAIRKCQPSIQLAKESTWVDGAQQEALEKVDSYSLHLSGGISMDTVASAQSYYTPTKFVSRETSDAANGITTNPVYPYRVKTWEELLATEGCSLDRAGYIQGPNNSFVTDMKCFCEKPLTTNVYQRLPDSPYHLETWMITENTPVKVNNIGIAQALPDLKSSNVDNTLDSTVYKVRPVTASLHKASKSKLIF